MTSPHVPEGERLGQTTLVSNDLLEIEPGSLRVSVKRYPGRERAERHQESQSQPESP